MLGARAATGAEFYGDRRSVRLRPVTTAREYRLISADSHVNEPPDLWTDRVPAALRDRAPRIEHFDEGDAWVIEGVSDPINFGMNACAGLEPEDMKGWVRFDDIRAGGYDPAARLVEMDRDGVDAEVLYPTPRLSQAIIANPDAEYHLAMVRAYNDWISEYVAYAPDRFGGLAILPNRGASSRPSPRSTACSTGPGMRGVVMGCYPNGTLSIEPEDDKVWGHARRARRPARHPRVPDADDAGGAPVEAARLRAVLRRPEPHDRADLRRRLRPLPGARRRVRRGRLRLGALRQGADRQQLPAPRSGEPLRSARRRRASTSSGTSTSAT